MDLPTIFFYIFCLFFTAVFIYSMWSKKGRKEMVELLINTKVVSEPLELGTTKLTPKFGLPVHQDLRLYRCTNNSGDVYVLEVTQKTIGSINRSFVQLPTETIKKMQAFTEVT